MKRQPIKWDKIFATHIADKTQYTCVISYLVVSSSLQPHGLYVAHQAPLSMGFSRQEYWSGLPFPSPGDLPDPGIESRSPTLQADSLLSDLPGKLSELPGSQYPKYIKNSFNSASKKQTIQFENRRNI